MSKRYMDNKHQRVYEAIIASAEQHGADSDPDHEVGDLQDALWEAIARLSPLDLKEFDEEMSQQFDYLSDDDEDDVEQSRRDEKHGLYGGQVDDTN